MQDVVQIVLFILTENAVNYVFKTRKYDLQTRRLEKKTTIDLTFYFIELHDGRLAVYNTKKKKNLIAKIDR